MPIQELMLSVKGEFQFGSGIPRIPMPWSIVRGRHTMTTMRIASVTYWRKDDDPFSREQILDRFVVTLRTIGFFFPDGSVGVLTGEYHADARFVRVIPDDSDDGDEAIMTPEIEQQLIALATEARARAYVPYSHYAVGAALLMADGQMHAGCNVENASYGLTSCAERNAIFGMIGKTGDPGARRIRAVVVVTAGEDPATPCGACRQVIREFGRDAVVVIANTEGRVFLRTTLDALLPHSFGPEQLESPNDNAGE